MTAEVKIEGKKLALWLLRDAALAQLREARHTELPITPLVPCRLCMRTPDAQEIVVCGLVYLGWRLDRLSRSQSMTSPPFTMSRLLI